MGRNGRPGGLIRWCLGTRGPERNRRSSRRFAALSRPALIGWVDGDQFLTTPAALKDVSLSGVSALLDEARPENSSVWVSLNDQQAGRWVQAVVVEVKRVRRALAYRKPPYLVRMRFGLGCPYTFFRAAVGNGAGAVVPGPSETLSGARPAASEPAPA